MSTLDSSLSSVATAIATDFHGRLRPGSTDRNKLKPARRLTALLGVLATAAAMGLAALDIGSQWDAFQGMMGLFGAGLAGLFALGVFTTRANGAGALACLAAGYAASLVLPDRGRSLVGLAIHTRRKPRPAAGV